MSELATVPNEMLEELIHAGDALARIIEANSGRTEVIDRWAKAWLELHNWRVMRAIEQEGT